MKTAEPKTIYLQIGEDADITEFKKEDFETNAITWCWERIHSNDIKYISKQFIIGLIDEMAEKESPYYRLGVAKIAILRELKQKIEELC